MSLKKLGKTIRSYPALALFFLLLFGMAFGNLCWPKRTWSELENRNMAQMPSFAWKDLMDGDFLSGFSSYLQDQFMMRDAWISTESFTNAAVLQKSEEGGILYGKDHWMFTKLFRLTASNKKLMNNNLSAVQTFAKAHPGKVTFLLAPSASDIYPEELPLAAPMIDEDSNLDAIFQSVGEVAEVIDPRAVFRENKNQYLYYKTDHHWTTLGAYLAYQQFCAQQGLTPFDASAASEQVTDFYGTHYSTARLWNAQPDTITWFPLENQMTIYQVSGEDTFTPDKTESLVNTEKFVTRSKYSAFLDGNNGYSVIDGNGSGSILVVKDSYANCFIPFLTANYAKIGVIDFRSFGYGLDALIDSEGYDHVLVLYNFQTFISDTHLFNLARSS
jgi:hypothetical protein